MDPLAADERKTQPREKIILLIEEDFLSRWSAAEYLRETGFDVIEAVSAVEALAAIRCGTPLDAVFCALDSSVETELVDYLKDRRPPVPMLLAVTGGVDRSISSQSSTREVIAKPYVMSDVERRLNAMIAAR